MLDKFPLWLIKLLSKIRSTLFPVLLCCVFFFASDFSAAAAEVSPDAENEWFLLPFNELGDIVGQFDDDQGTYYATGSGSTRFLQFEVGTTNSSVLPLLKSGNKYLIYGTVSLASSNTTGSPSSISLYEFINDRTKPYQWSNNSLDKHVDFNRSTYSISGIYSFTMEENIFLNTGGALVWEQTEAINFNGRCSWAFYALDITDTSESEVNQIVAAINNQTTEIGGKIDNTNDLIDNGNENTGALINDVSSANDQLNEIWGEYEEIEDGFIDDYESASADLVDDFTGFSWLGAGEAIIWVSERFSQIYIALGDFRMYILYPLLLGIAMFFIGRGQVILNNLSRRWYKDE